MIEIKDTKEENNILNKEELNILKTKATLNNSVEDQHLIMLNPMGLDRNSIGFKTTVTVATYLGVIKSRVPMIISDSAFHNNCLSVYDILQMVDNMVKCNNNIQEAAHGQQLWLFDYDYERQNCFTDLFPFITNNFQDLTDLYIRFYENTGIKYYTKDLNATVKKMEQENLIEIVRFPSQTPKGRHVTSLDYTKYKILIRKKK